MRGVSHAQADQHSPLYTRLTRVHQARSTDHVTAGGPVPIEVLLRAELHRCDGSPEWRSWVARAARRHGITLFEELSL